MRRLEGFEIKIGRTGPDWNGATWTGRNAKRLARGTAGRRDQNHDSAYGVKVIATKT
jgi:hypothetical protein